MAKELHLHVGVHKTATTHLQSILQLNTNPEDDFTFVETKVFRKSFTRGNRFVSQQHTEETQSYLENLIATEKKRLIISEENIIGEAKDIFGTEQLYPRAASRLAKLSKFVSRFEHSTIWVSVRSLDTFLPSMYSEYLRHWQYRPFKSVLNGHYQQSWIPLIRELTLAFPNSKINIVPYEQYATRLPCWLEQMTGRKEGWELLPNSRPRASHSRLAIKLARIINPIVGSHRVSGLIDKVSEISHKHPATKGKFSPFDQSTQNALKDQYNKDLIEATSLSNNIDLFGKLKTAHANASCDNDINKASPHDNT